MSTSQKNKTATFIKWIDVETQLPKSGVSVLALLRDQHVIQTAFYANRGWAYLTGQSCARERDEIIFWSYFNIPK